jgi:peptide-methionine (S)-S-oxide reductase
MITIFWASLIRRLRVFADERGLFRKFLGVILLFVWLLILTGIDKKIETYLVTNYDVTSLETWIIKKITPNHSIIMNTEPKIVSEDPLSSSDDPKMEKAYFAGGCFWCMEWIFEAQPGVKQAISGYAEGEMIDANYEKVSSGDTKHREAVEVTYDPSVINFATLVDLYYTQIDPTQVDGQFADKGYRYTTAIYHRNEQEKKIIENAKKILQDSKKFEKPIAVQTVPFTTFFPAEEYHQDYYKKSAFRYGLYKEGSGRAWFIEKNGQTWGTLAPTWGTLAPTEIPKKSQYRPYDERELQTLTGAQILLFFHAEWCSTCRNFDKQIIESSLPKNLVIYQVDYDSATELKKKYSILSQSTWVQIDSTGKAYKRWLGKSQLSDILSDLASTRDILSQKLTPLQFEVTQMGGTERPFDNAYWDNYAAGIYVDIVDGTPLFSSTDKFDSGTGWPSFSRPISESLVSEHLDTKLDQNRTEVKSNGGSHLGHVFNDWPSEEGWLRYCINSAALRFVPVADLKKEGYSEYLRLFGSGFIQK